MSKDIAIDLGTANTKIYVRGKGLVVIAPSVVAVNLRQDEVIAVGQQAKDMMGRAPGSISVIRPIKDSVIGDFDAACQMVKTFIKQAMGQSYFGRPVVKLGFPKGITEVEEMALKEVAEAAGCKKPELIPSIATATIGASIPFNSPKGVMVVDMGAGTCEAAVLSMGGIVVSKMTRLAGDTIDESIIPYVKKEYGMLIGKRTAEEIKITIGSAVPKAQEEYMEVRGRDLYTGLPKNIRISSSEITDTIKGSVDAIVSLIKSVLEETPPELLADIIDEGITLTGGTSLLSGIDKLVQLETGMKVTVAENPMECTIAGLGRCVDNETVRKLPAMEYRRV
ncbi:MAG: rod shape-determining protein [Ruminococcaceae bacterium]|nr:rod shape-determining protein [Oscillospiraceae bacterium]